MDRIKSFVRRCEENNIGFGLWICTALFIIFIRDSVESLVSTGFFPAVSSFHLLHVPIFFISLLLAIILVLHFFSGTEIVKVSRIGLTFFAVIILPVVIDFLLCLVLKREIVYEYITENVGKSFINFFNPFFKIPEVPFSLRIEITIITALSFIYVFFKRNKILLSLLGTFLIFVLCFFYIAIPGILSGAVLGFFRLLISLSQVINLRLGAGLMATVEEKNVVIIQLLFTLILAFAWFWRYDIKKWRALLKNFRYTRSFHYMLMVIMGLVLCLSGGQKTDMFVLIEMLGMLCAIFFAFQFSVVVNDIFDIDCDRISNKTRPLITGILDKSEYLKIGIVYLAFALLFAFWVSSTCFMITLLFIAVYFIYSIPVFRLKRFFPISSLIIGIQALLAFLLGQLSLERYAGQHFDYPSMQWLVFIVFALSSNVKDLKDIEGDRHCKVYSLPVIFGELKARKIIATLVLSSYLITSLFLYPMFRSSIIAVLALLFGLINYFYIKTKNAREKVIFYIYFVYAFIVLLFFLW